MLDRYLWYRCNGSFHPLRVEVGPREDGGKHRRAVGQAKAGTNSTKLFNLIILHQCDQMLK